MALLSVTDLTMRFGGLTAVKEVRFDVEPGQIFSVIGPNGAGKTTVFNAITGIYKPTAGRITFAGDSLRRQLSPRVWIASLAVGLFLSLSCVLICANVDRLWQIAITRNNNDPAAPFTYIAALRDAWTFLLADLRVEKIASRRKPARWAVAPAEADRPALTIVDSKAEAENLREALAVVMRHPDESLLQPRNGGWELLSIDGKQSLLTFANRAEAAAKLAELADARSRQLGAQRTRLAALLLGFALGVAVALVVWQRSRGTPDVVARRGIARTFQNIRLFSAMSACENVQVGLDYRLRGSLLAAVLRTPGARRQQAMVRQQAIEQLRFVGLEKFADSSADALPYGDQRRLEIARALAAQPRLLLLDEPAAGMNPSETAELTRLIRRIRDQGVTVLLIEHHMRVVMGISDRIAVLDYGVKIAEGTPEEIRCNPKVIEAYLGKEELG